MLKIKIQNDSASNFHFANHQSGVFLDLAPGLTEVSAAVFKLFAQQIKNENSLVVLEALQDVFDVAPVQIQPEAPVETPQPEAPVETPEPVAEVASEPAEVAEDIAPVAEDVPAEEPASEGKKASKKK